MNPEAIINGSMLAGKSIGFHHIPKQYVDAKDIDGCVKSMQDQLSVDPKKRDAAIKKYQNFLSRNGLPGHPKVLTGAELEKKQAIHQEFVKNFTTSYAPLLFYYDHLTFDYNLRFVSNDIMHRTVDKEADLKFNRRITELFGKAERKVFSDDSPEMKSDRKKTEDERKELLTHIRTYVNRIKQFDVKKIAECGLSDEELAKNPLYYSNMALLGGQFDNIRHEFSVWGIHDSDIEETMHQFDDYADFFSAVNQRLGYIMDPAYAIFDEKSLLEASAFMEDNALEAIDSGASQSVLESTHQLSNFREFQFNSEQHTIQSFFTDLGFPKDDIVCLDPNNNQETTNLYLGLSTEDSVTVYSKSQPDLKMTFGSFSDMKYTRMLMAEKHLDFQKAVKKPKSLTFLDRIADTFSKIFYGNKPRAEKYAKDVSNYNSLATLFDPKSVIPTNPPEPKNPMHELFGIRHFLQKEIKTKEDFLENMRKLNELAVKDPDKQSFQNSVRTLAEKYQKELKAYNAKQTDPNEKIVLSGEVTRILNNNPKPVQQAKQPVQQANQPVQQAKQPVQQVNQPVQQVNQPEPVKKEEPKLQIKVKQKPQPSQPAPREPNIYSANPTTVDALEKRLELAARYTGEYAMQHVSSMLEGHVSLHEPAPQEDLMIQKPLAAVVLFGQAPEKFPGKEGLSPMEKKMQYLERVMTERGFTKSEEHRKFMAQCHADFKRVQDAAYQNNVKDSDTIRDFVSYLNEGAKSIQHLTLCSPRMSITTPMLGACAEIIQKELVRGKSSFHEKEPSGTVKTEDHILPDTSRELPGKHFLQKNAEGVIMPHVKYAEKIRLYNDRDLAAMANVNARSTGVQLLAKIYTDGLKAQVALTKKNTLDDAEKDRYVSDLMTAEGVNQSIIAPGHKESVQAVKENQHPTAHMLSTLGNRPMSNSLRSIRSGVTASPTYQALKQIKQSEISSAILNQPEKIASAAADISTEILTGKPACANPEKEIRQKFDSSKSVEAGNWFIV